VEQNDNPFESGGKSFFSISEASDITGLRQHVLRYWETQFSVLRPKKNRAGNRLYRKKDIQIALTIKKLLYKQGFTINGARKKLLQDRKQGQMELSMDEVDKTFMLKTIKKELKEILKLART
jgi:DNA-binding transcriptional MerR regulator